MVIKPLLVLPPGRPPLISHRKFLNAVLWKVRAGVHWRDLLQRYGSWKTIYIRGITLGADAGYNTNSFLDACKELEVEAHAADTSYCLPSMLYRERYHSSQKVRKRIESIFGWAKICAGIRKTRYKGHAKNELLLYMTSAAYNLLRMAKLMPCPP